MKITKKFESSAVNTFKNGDPIDFIYGKGEYLYTKNNKKYLDLVCGSAVTNLGHGHKAHKDAIKEVIKTGIFHTGTRLPNYFRENLYKKQHTIKNSKTILMYIKMLFFFLIQALIKTKKQNILKRKV